jgi:hypothetical protein
VRQQATAVVAVHNHPSGDPTPSTADVALTVEIVAAGQLLDIELLDHLIIGQGRWLSLKRLGLGFAKEELMTAQFGRRVTTRLRPRLTPVPVCPLPDLPLMARRRLSTTRSSRATRRAGW